MSKNIFRILQISSSDKGGGAEKVALNLHHEYKAMGHNAWLCVGEKYLDDVDIFTIPNQTHKNIWTRFFLSAGDSLSFMAGKIRGAGRLQKGLYTLGQPERLRNTLLGHENFEFPCTREILTLTPESPQIIHCHNLHSPSPRSGGYFDLRALPWLCKKIPVLLTLHDAWLLSGHCAHSFECERWKTGCGHCPDLSIYPSILRDATAYNWLRKQEIYAKSKLYVSTPSRWLMDKVQQSMLAPAILESRVIPNGIDMNVFKPGDKESARMKLGIPPHAKILLFSAKGIQRNRWKDYETMVHSVAKAAEESYDENLLFIALGEKAPSQKIGRARVQFIPYQEDPKTVPCYYQAADIYIHASRADTFPNSVIEALACGIPVIATAVGGIPEQIKNLNSQHFSSHSHDLTEYGKEEATGILTPTGNSDAMAGAISFLLKNNALRICLSGNASKDAAQRFNLHQQSAEYLEWYKSIIQRKDHEYPEKGETC